MLTGTPLDLTPFGPVLSAIGWLYWLIAAAALWWALRGHRTLKVKLLRALPVVAKQPFSRVFGMTSRRTRLTVFAIGIFTTCMAHPVSTDVAEWTEEVLLSNQQIVRVWRRARAYSGGFPDSARGRNIEVDFRYAPRNARWHGQLSDSFYRDPVAFDVIDGDVYLVNYIFDREGCRNRPASDYSAQFLRWNGASWSEVAQADFPVDKVLVNLSDNYWGRKPSEDFHGTVLWKDKILPGSIRRGAALTVRGFFEGGSRFCSQLQR